MNIAINGFGRIGRTVFKIALEKGLKVVAINDLHGPKDAAYLLKYDSVYGRYKKKVDVSGDYLIVDRKKIKVVSESDPEKLPWKNFKVDVVVESTGVFRDKDNAEKHLNAGAKYVLITAPAEKPDITIVPGVNHGKLKKEHKIISVASCTTNCLVPVIKVLNDNFGIVKSLVTTVHAYTNDQAIHDSSHKKARRGRAATVNMIPTTTGSSEAFADVMPELVDRINGLAIRVPIICGSLLDVVAELEKEFDEKKVNEAFIKASKKELNGILAYTEEEIVSSDVIGTPYSAIVDGLSTQANGNLVKVLAWYDNEYGYSCRVVDVIKMVKKFVSWW
ncbi:type I glyceraldehyde-3-phosphate dehydrogenase [Candidatus Pacearchaeota archaeon]|nr:type I glyceraldehyde-3-phosphate dehydrogenase [Candidatus Pacearchaeota archaeon]